MSQNVNQGPHEVTEDLPRLTEPQELAIIALLEEPTVPAAAVAAGVEVRDLRRWMVEDENFIVLRRHERRERFAGVVRLLHEKAGLASRGLLEMARDPKTPARVRVSATKTLLSFAFDAVEETQVIEPIEAAKAAQHFDAGMERAQGSVHREKPTRPRIDPLTPLQERAVEALALHGSIVEAAEHASVGLRTLQRWLVENANFEAHARLAREERFAHVGEEIQRHADVLLDGLLKIATDDQCTVSTRLSATKTLLHFAQRGQQLLGESEELETTRELYAARDRERRSAA